MIYLSAILLAHLLVSAVASPWRMLRVPVFDYTAGFFYLTLALVVLDVRLLVWRKTDGAGPVKKRDRIAAAMLLAELVFWFCRLLMLSA